MFKQVIFLFFLSFSSFGFAIDLSFKEKSPIDRLYDENYQGIKKLQTEQKFKFDPKKKLPKRIVATKIYWHSEMPTKSLFSIRYAPVILTQQGQGARIQPHG